MKKGMLTLAALLLGSNVVHAEVVRYPIPNSTFPIAQAVKVSGDAVTLYVSGQVPPVINKDVEAGSLAIGRARQVAFANWSRPKKQPK